MFINSLENMWVSDKLMRMVRDDDSRLLHVKKWLLLFLKFYKKCWNKYFRLVIEQYMDTSLWKGISVCKSKDFDLDKLLILLHCVVEKRESFNSQRSRQCLPFVFSVCIGDGHLCS